MIDISATQAFAIQHLKMKEIDFLLAFGWIDLGNGLWKPPPKYLKCKDAKYDKSHAVNSQKWVIRNG